MILINASSRDTTKIFQAFYPVHPPVGIGYLVAAAEARGIKAHYIDQQVDDNVLEQVAEYVKEMEKPYIFGFTVLTAALSAAVKTAERLKELYPGCFIVFGGVHPSMAPGEIMEIECVDAVIRGEGEGPLMELYECLKAGKDYSHIDNLSYRKGDEVIENPHNFIIGDLDDYPPFPYHIFDPEKYDMGFIISSRGCPFKCIFCSIQASPGGRRYRYRSAKSIVNDLEVLHDNYGIKSALFLDDNFLVNRKRIYALIEEMKSRNFGDDMRLAFQARGDSMERELLTDMYNAGFKVILFGIETASEEIMKVVQKGETVKECVDGIRLAKDIGFYVSGTFVFGFPGDSHRERINCLDLAKELELDEVRFNNAVPYPGTEMYRIGKTEDRLNIIGYYENFIAVSAITENPFEKVPLAFVPEGSTEQELKRDVLLCSFAAYFSVMDIFGIVFKKHSHTKWFSFGDKPFEVLKKVPAGIYLALMLGVKFTELLYFLFINRKTALPFRHVMQVLFKRSPTDDYTPRCIPCDQEA